MTPTPTVLLLVAIFWTLPASAAALVYRRNGYSLENVKASVQRSVDQLMGNPHPRRDLKARPDA